MRICESLGEYSMPSRKLKYLPSINYLPATITLADSQIIIWAKNTDTVITVNHHEGLRQGTAVAFLQPGDYFINRNAFAISKNPYEQPLPLLTGVIENTFKIAVSDTFGVTISQCDHKPEPLLKELGYQLVNIMNSNTLDSLNQELVRSTGEVLLNERNYSSRFNFGYIPPNMLKELTRDGSNTVTTGELVEYRLARLPRNLLLKFKDHDTVYNTDTDREAIGNYLKEYLGDHKELIELNESISYFGCFNQELNVDITTFTNNRIQTNLEFNTREGLDNYISTFFPKGRFKTVSVNDYYEHPERKAFEASLDKVVGGTDTNLRWQERCLNDFVEILENTIIPDAEKEGLDAIILVSPIGVSKDDCSWSIFTVLYTTKDLGNEVYNILTLNAADNYYSELLKYYVCVDFYCYHSGFPESMCPF